MSRFDTIKMIARVLGRAGYPTYLVGGAVRDLVLNVKPKDLDLATRARPDDVVRLLEPHADAIFHAGKDFGVIGVKFGEEVYEVATFRGERYDGESRKPVVDYANTIEEDLARRDFTMNAMAIDLNGFDVNYIIDPFDAKLDLEACVLRTPGHPAVSFRDDPLRIVRAARFIAKYGLTPGAELEAAARNGMLALSRIVSVERIRDELVKLLLVHDPTAGLDFLARTGVSDVFLPELNRMRMEDEGGGFKDVYTHTLAVVRQAPVNRLTRLAALFHDVAKPATFSRETGHVSFHHHEVLGATMTNDRMRALKFDNDTTAAVTKLVRLHLRVHTADDWTDKAVRRYIRDAGDLLQELNDLQRADVTTKSGAKRARLDMKMTDLELRITRIQEEEGREVVKPPLDGRQVMEILNAPAGRVIGEALEFLLELRLDNGLMTEAEATTALLEWHAARP